MKWKFVLAALAIAVPMPALADPAPAGTFVPEQIHLGNDGVYISGGATYANPENCASNTYIKIVASTSAELERHYSALVTSLASGKSVTVWINGCVMSVWGYTVPKGYHLVLNR